MAETQFIAFFIVLLVAVFFSSLFKKFKLPWAVALIVGGIIAGPNLLNFIDSNETIEFMAEIGAIFLMFMAGLEAPLSSFKKSANRLGVIAFINGFIPMLVGISIGMFFGFSLTVSILMGIIFISSSIAVVVPTLDRRKMLNTPLGHVIVGSTVLQDISSLILISIFLQINDPVTQIPLPIFYMLVTLIIVVLYRLIRWFKKWIIKEGSFNQEFQLILLILIGVVVLFSVLGLHYIIAGFFAGLVLSESLHNKKIKNSLHTTAYGIFIPIFFVMTGAHTDFTVFANVGSVIMLTSILIIGLMLSKFLSGYISSRYERFNRYDSLLIAITSMPKLATTLAVVYTAHNKGIIGIDLVTAFIILTIVTTTISPLLTQLVLKKKTEAFSE